MNRPGLLHIIERLEGFLGKLPESIRRPVLHELTPLKELFLQQRAPRFIITGSNTQPLQEIAASLFRFTPAAEPREVLMELYRWHAMELGGRGTVSFLDARGADLRPLSKITAELKTHPADLILHVEDGDSHPVEQAELDNVATFLTANPGEHAAPKLIGVVFRHPNSRGRGPQDNEGRVTATRMRSQLQSVLQQEAGIAPHLIQVVEISSEDDARQFMTLLARSVPNEARVEMARIANDHTTQTEIAQTLVKSTTAICSAIGAQPIPLADLPILTALQLLMVSGIMYISGRERSLRAATEFVGALGVNVGAGMILREGARALLKFFPGWGNVVCGAVAGAGTYAIGRAAIVYFLEGLTLMDARRAYLSSRKKRARSEVHPIKQIEAAR
jgi:uncharacterized protein (DUF697 family)